MIIIVMNFFVLFIRSIMLHLNRNRKRLLSNFLLKIYMRLCHGYQGRRNLHGRGLRMRIWISFSVVLLLFLFSSYKECSIHLLINSVLLVVRDTGLLRIFIYCFRLYELFVGIILFLSSIHQINLNYFLLYLRQKILFVIYVGFIKCLLNKISFSFQ